MSYMVVSDVSTECVRKIEDALESDGWTAVAYPGKDSYPPFAHTIGLGTSFAHPEVFLLGFPPDMAVAALNTVVRYLKHGVHLAIDLPEDGVSPGFAVREIEGRAASRIGFVARELYEDGIFDAVQLVLPDHNGLYPWDEGCDPELAWNQTILLDAFGDLEASPRPN